jgi:hypothetical protein
VIEVYPAANLKLHNLPHKQYKKSAQVQQRQLILDGLKMLRIYINNDLSEKALENSDKLDAVVCVLAAKRFLDRAAFGPTEDDVALAKKEGWIWV